MYEEAVQGKIPVLLVWRCDDYIRRLVRDFYGKKKKVLFIYNPCAGKGTLRNKLADIIDLMMKRQWDVSIAATQKAGDAAEYIMQKGTGCDRVICSGGDGTLHEVIHGLMAFAAGYAAGMWLYSNRNGE